MATRPKVAQSRGERVLPWVLLALAGVGVLYATEHAVALVRPVTGGAYLELLKAAA